MFIDEVLHYYPLYSFDVPENRLKRYYRHEQDIKTKERILLFILNVVYRGKVSAQVAKDLYQSTAWACGWLKRYNKEGINGLKTRSNNGRSIEMLRD